MQKFRLDRLVHLVCYALVLVFLVYGYFVARQGQEAFLKYLPEDGLVENLTVLFLLASCVVAFYRIFHAPQGSRIFYYIFWGFLGILFLFAIGEEISWGQRIFNYKTSGFFQENNLQKETNLHNLVIGNIKINKLVFSQLLGLVVGFYFLLLRPLTAKITFFDRIVRLFGIPLPRWEHVIALIICIILTSRYHLMKAAELREFAFSIILFLVLLYPAESGKKQ